MDFTTTTTTFVFVSATVLFLFTVLFINKCRSLESPSSVVVNTKKILLGSMGWPFIGETLDFIACGYTDRPQSFMDKRRQL
ncbi:putative 3-epi-6-deoxocathasterone 23-monooxygenase [Helianthus annuus]|nr:putative 3-epi-6-deoxocathasterone 23-monooxygenase [Helianthus annuus]KAJ0523560.1 putative 3-epi-6-deoxocathasterone 23-monooxygenase [Helianthus annuus]KAJ0698172.1 putative 3-epi-6-deoxocathasterone 23-monooxygenase [Helianthus annuus]KAJ0701539.1 putative 3-epi-6-deoxocathasterone 23-monooxygenase [Helianthus annuus]